MQVFKLYLKLFRSYIPSSMIYLVVFFSIAIPLSKAGSEQLSFKESSVKLAVFDEDNSAASRKLIENIDLKNDVTDIANDHDTIMDALYYTTINYVITIKKGYEDILKDPSSTGDDIASVIDTMYLSENYSVAMMEQYLDEYIHSVRGYIAGGATLDKAISSTEDELSRDIDVTYETFSKNSSAESDFTENMAYFFRYLPYVFISILINALAPILLTFNKKDQNNRIRCSSLSSTSFSSQLFAGTGVIVFAVWANFMIGSVVMNGGIFNGVAWIAVLNAFLFALISATIALLVSAFKPSESVINMITQIIALGMCFLCGVFVPQSVLGDGVLAAAKFLPAYWYTRANDTLCGMNTFDIGEIWMCIGVEFGFLILLVIATMTVNKIMSNTGRSKASGRAVG